MPRLSRPVTAQRARLYLRCFFTGTGQAAVSRRRICPAFGLSSRASTALGAIKEDSRDRPRESLLHARPFALPDSFSSVRSGRGGNRKSPHRSHRRTRRAAVPRPAAHIVHVRVEFDVADARALQLLERDRVGPEQADGATVRAQRASAADSASRPAIRDVRGRIVPVHEQRAIPGVEIKTRPARPNRPAR